ncbi:MAG: class I SAM-dependent methyltransferase, partial [Planctomycetales bacterium]|nr:class I SAM-dependent methyltransferase [Planctomycetales bacterium]
LPTKTVMLVCPHCQSPLRDIESDSQPSGVAVATAEQVCTLTCDQGHSFPVVREIPRFVPESNYADCFGFQWTKHAKTQHDQFSGVSISEERFFNETKWPRDLHGELILEVGCGSGRFTTHALSTGADVYSVDLSNAVEINHEINGAHPRLHLCQADILSLPFREQSFDRAFCIGVLQHTPDPESSFHAIAQCVRSGGSLVVDVYDKREGLLSIVEPLFRTYLWIRPLTKNMRPEALYNLVNSYVNFMWPIGRAIGAIPVVGRKLNKMLLIHDYRRRFELSEDQLREWAVLDAFDNLSPQYDQRQTLSTVRRWFDEAGFRDVEVHYGYNGIEGRGIAG